MAIYRTPYKKVKSGKQESTVTLEQYHIRYGAESPEEPTPPEGGERILEWFWSLSSSRGSGFESPQPLSFSEIQAWSNLTGTIIRPVEVEIIKRMDLAYLGALAETREAARQESET